MVLPFQKTFSAFLISCSIGGTLAGSFAQADEGMWTFNNLPKEQLKARYGFEPTQEWLDHVMRSSVRFNSGGSGSFVSSDGLVLTNHHVAADTLAKISTADRDYYKTGFYAETLEQEIPAPDLELNQLVSIEDVTARVMAAVKPGMTPGEALTAKRAVIAQIEKESLAQTGLRSDVVTLYQGGVYNLYRYKKYTDVRVVFAPEFAIAFFGGDPDNFEYPRYDLDMAIMRVYENGKPAVIKDYLKWSQTGVKADELVFVSGHPGTTNRMFTMDALRYLRDVRLPFQIEFFENREAALKAYRALGEEQARQAQEDFFSVQNSLKAYRGRIGGLRDEAIMAEKARQEAELKAQVAERPDLAPLLPAWEQIAQAQKANAEIQMRRSFLEQGWMVNSTLFSMARTLVRMAAEDQKPNSDRLPEYKDSARESLNQALFSSAPIYPEFEIAKLTASLAYAESKLGSKDPTILKVLAGKTPAARAAELVSGSKLVQISERQALAKGGQAAIDSSQDAMILLAKALDDESRSIRKQYEQRVEGVETQAYGQISQALFGVYGTNRYPDATFTLRLSFGAVKGYTENGQEIAPWTDFGGAFAHEAAHGGVDPYQLPESWHRAKNELNLGTQFNFVSTADIIGGNSGSPVINREGELVGLIFDGNIQSLVGAYIYDDTQNRAVSVSSAGMLEALRKVYKVPALADRLGN